MQLPGPDRGAQPVGVTCGAAAAAQAVPGPRAHALSKASCTVAGTEKRRCAIAHRGPLRPFPTQSIRVLSNGSQLVIQEFPRDIMRGAISRHYFLGERAG